MSLVAQLTEAISVCCLHPGQREGTQSWKACEAGACSPSSDSTLDCSCSLLKHFYTSFKVI
jgi:hypothetical protein